MSRELDCPAHAARRGLRREHIIDLHGGSTPVVANRRYLRHLPEKIRWPKFRAAIPTTIAADGAFTLTDETTHSLPGESGVVEIVNGDICLMSSAKTPASPSEFRPVLLAENVASVWILYEPERAESFRSWIQDRVRGVARPEIFFVRIPPADLESPEWRAPSGG